MSNWSALSVASHSTYAISVHDMPCQTHAHFRTRMCKARHQAVAGHHHQQQHQSANGLLDMHRDLDGQSDLD